MQKTVMIVDDSASVRTMMAESLHDAGYRVREAENGRLALKLLSEESPDVILLDIVMPEMDGFEFLEQLKGTGGTVLIPVIVVSSLQDVEKRVKAFEKGADDFLIKPVEKTELLARVKSLVKVKAFHDHMMSYQKELEVDVRDKNQQLLDAKKKIRCSSWEVIFRLCNAAEYRDEVTGNHIWRLGRYASVIAREIDLNDETTELLSIAAAMHDVGKIGIPDAILLKPGALDSREWEIMKTHTAIGGQILQGSSLEVIRMAETIALTHHEKWDGSGYPNGLRGDEIPIAGRIAAIADVFDALTSKRPYKEAYTLEKAFRIIQEEKGKHFDPRIVEGFFSAQDEILYIQAFEQDGSTHCNFREELLAGSWGKAAEA